MNYIYIENIKKSSTIVETIFTFKITKLKMGVTAEIRSIAIQMRKGCCEIYNFSWKRKYFLQT